MRVVMENGNGVILFSHCSVRSKSVNVAITVRNGYNRSIWQPEHREVFSIRCSKQPFKSSLWTHRNMARTRSVAVMSPCWKSTKAKSLVSGESKFWGVSPCLTLKYVTVLTTRSVKKLLVCNTYFLGKKAPNGLYCGLYFENWSVFWEITQPDFRDMSRIPNILFFIYSKFRVPLN